MTVKKPVMSTQRRTINLLKGYPHPSLLPAAAITRAAATALARPEVSTPALLYGADEGYQPLRRAIAAWNSAYYGREVGPERVVITGGASQNLACVLQVLSDPLYTAAVWLCSPAYMLVFRSFLDHGFADKMRAVPEEGAEGMDVAWLARELELCDSGHRSSRQLKPLRPYAKHFRHIIYCVPTFSNPSSSVLSLDKREALVRLARKHDALLVADDVYDHLAWPSSTSVPSAFAPTTKALQPRLSDVDAALDGGPATPFGNALSNGSFSKITGPGARCGWAEASTAKLAYAVSQAGSTHSGGAPSQLVSSFMCELLESGWLREHIGATLQPTYARRWATVRDALVRYAVPLGCTVVEPGRYMGGFFVWVRLPVGITGDDVVDRAREEQDLILISGSKFEVPGEETIRHNDHVRLCFTWEDEEVLEEGVKRLADAIRTSLQRS